MRLIVGVFAIAALAASCSDPFKPTTENVVGDYSLQALTTATDTGGTVNWVTAGATCTISLAANGTTTGHLFLPGADTGGADFNADLAGTWMLTGDTIQFDQTADSFVRDMPFVAGENRLTADHTFGNVRVRLVLTK